MASVTQRTDLNPPVLNVLDLTNQAIEEGDRIRAAAGPGDETSFTKALGAGVDLSQSLMWRFVENIADWQDWEGLQKMASEGAEMNEEQAAKYKRLSLAESEGLSGVAKWMHDTIGTQLPMLAVPLATGGLAAFATMLVGAPAAVGTAAALTGAYAANYVLNTGEAYSNQLQYGGNISPEKALVTGGMAAILDTLVPGALLRRLGLIKAFNKNLSEKLAKGTVLGNQFKRAFEFSLAEGSTEGLQEVVYKIGRNWANEELAAGHLTPEDRAEIVEGFFAGMLIGKGVGLVTPAGTAKARQQVEEAKTFDDAKKGAISSLQDEVAAIGAKKGKETPEDRAAVKDLKGKIRELRKTKTLDEINAIIPPIDEDVPPGDDGPGGPEVILRELGPTEVADARTVLGNKKEHSDEEITEAEQVMRVSAALKVKPKQEVSEDVLNIRILGVEESQAVDVTYDLDPKQQGTYFYLRDQGAPHEAAMEGAKKGTTKWKGPALSDRYVRPSKEAVTTREDAVARIAEIDAEIDALMAEGVTPEGLGDLVSRPARDEKVRDLKARKVELQKTLRGLPTTTPREAETTPPVTPTRPTEAAPEEGVPARDFATLVDQRIAESEAKIEDLNAQYEAVTGSRFNKKRKRNIINEELESTQRELAGLQRLKARQGEETRTEGILIPGRVRPEERTGVVWEDVAVTEELPPPPAPAVPSGVSGLEIGVAPTAEQIRARQVERDLATQEEAGLREAVEQNRLEAAAREQARAEDEAAAAADAAEAEAAAAAADLEAERLLDEKAQAETARQRIKAKESVITTPGLDPSTLKNEDVTVPGVSDADIRQAQIIKWNNNKRRKNSSRAAEAERIKNEEEVARQEEALNQRREDARKEAENAAKTEAATRKENIDADKEAKKEEAESARLYKEFVAEETKKTVLWAQNRAADTVDEFSESGYSRSRMVELALSRRRSIETSDRIGGSEAAIAYKEIVERGINEIESARVEKARTTAETTREEGGKEPTPAGLTLNEFQAEYERIRTEQGEDAATQYFKDEAQNVAVEETTGGRPAVEPKTTKKKTTKKKAAQKKDVISDRVYNRFVKDGYVPPAIINSIAQKIVNNETLSERELAIRVADKVGEKIEARTVEIAEGVEVTKEGPEEAAQARVISSPRDAIDAVKDGMEPDDAIVQLAEGMNVSPEEAWVAFNDETTQADAQEIIKSAEERGAVEAGTTNAMLKEAGETKPAKTVSPSKVAEADKEKKDPEKTGRTATYTGFRKSRSGNYWTAKIAGSPARIREDEVGEFHAVYEGSSYPTPFTSWEAAKIHLLDTYGTPKERAKIKRPKVIKTEGPQMQAQREAKKQKYAEPTVNKAGHTVQVTYEPDVDVNRPHIRHFEGKPISRHPDRDSAMRGLWTMDEAKAKEVIRIQEDRIARLEGKAVTQAEKDARATARIDKARAAAEDLGGSVREIRKLDINQQPLPSATHTIIIGRPNVKTDSPGETRFVNEVLEEEDMHPVTVSYEIREMRTKDRTRPERFSENDTSREKFNTFTPFVASTKKDALVLSQSIYANAQKFHRFLQNEVSLQRNPMSLSLGLINDAEAFEFQKAYQGLIRQEKAKETRRKKLTTEQKNSIERWEQKIQDLQTADGRSFKSTIVPGEMGEVTLDSFNDSLQKWIDQLEDTGADTTALREVLANNKKKVDRPSEVVGPITPPIEAYAGETDLEFNEKTKQIIDDFFDILEDNDAESIQAEWMEEVIDIYQLSGDPDEALIEWDDKVITASEYFLERWDALKRKGPGFEELLWSDESGNIILDAGHDYRLRWIFDQGPVVTEDVTPPLPPEEMEDVAEDVQVATDKDGVAVFEGGLDKTAPISGTHVSSNIESVIDGFETRYFKGVPVGVSIARIKGEEMTSPTLAEPGGTPGLVSVIVRGRGMDYNDPADRKIIDDLEEESRKKSQAAVARGVKHGEEGTMISAIPALLERGVDWVNGWNSMGEASELHVINPSMIEIVGRGELSYGKRKHILESNIERMLSRGEEVPEDYLAEARKDVEEPISDEVYDNAINEGRLAFSVMRSIADKIGEGEALSPRETEINSIEFYSSVIEKLTPIRKDVEDPTPVLTKATEMLDELEGATVLDVEGEKVLARRLEKGEVARDVIDRLNSQLDKGEKLEVSHVGATDIGFGRETNDNLRRMDMEVNLGSLLGRGGIDGISPSDLEETQISLAEGNNFLTGAGSGSNILVLHRIPDEATSKAGEEFTGPVAEDHTIENWRQAILLGRPDIIYIFGESSRGDFVGRDFTNMPGYELVGEMDQQGKIASEVFTVFKKVPISTIKEVPGRVISRDKQEELEEVDKIISLPLEKERRNKAENEENFSEMLAEIDWGLKNVPEVAALEIQKDIDESDVDDLDPPEDWNPGDDFNALFNLVADYHRKLPDIEIPDSLVVADDGTIHINPDILDSVGYDTTDIRSELGMLLEADILPFRKTPTAGLMSDVDDELKQMQKDRDYQEWKEKKDRGKQKTEDKIDPDYILENENPAELYAKLSATLSQGGYSATEIKSLAANIKAANPDFKYNPKGKKADVAASIMEWYTKPMDEGYVGTAEEQREYEDRENDDIVESRRTTVGGLLLDIKSWNKPRTWGGIPNISEGSGPFRGVKVRRRDELTPEQYRTAGTSRVGELTGKVLKRGKSGRISYQVRFVRVLEKYDTPRYTTEWVPSAQLVLDETGEALTEARRLDSKPDFLSPDRATSTIGKAVNNIFGERIGRRMLSIGFINLINSSTAREMGASSTAQAFVSRKNGAIYFISDRIGSDMDENSIRGLMFHELGVHLGKDVFSGAEWNTVLNEVYNLSKANDPIVNAAVARVMKAYDYKKIDSGQPAVSGKPHVSFQGRREFWEEVLAHVVEIKQPGPIIVNNKLTDKIRNAFRKFFSKIFKAFGGLSPSDTRSEPSVTIDDLVNLVGYATTQAGVIGLERHGDSKLMSKFRDKKRREFLEGSMVKEPMYHGTKTDWGGAGTHPFIETAELGLHVGTALAAIKKVTKRRHSFLERDKIPYDDVEVRAFEPGWEKKISNKVLGNIYLDWGESSMETPEPGKSYPMGSKYTTFYDTATIKQGYINVQNPLPVYTDIGGWNSPYGWNNEALRVLSGDRQTYFGIVKAENRKKTAPVDEDVWVKISNLATKHMRYVPYSSDFEKKLRELLISEGYDSVEYVNNAEDVGSISYILLSDNQFKSIDDLAYDSGVSIFSTKKGISATTSSNIQESRRVERESFKEVALSRIGNARASSISNWIQRRVEPLMTIPGYDMLETERMLAKGRIGEWANTGRVIFDILNNANTAERKAIFKYFTTRDADPKMLSDRKVEFAERQTIVRGRTPGDKDVTKTESLRERVVKTKELIAKMGQNLVDEGFISNEQYSEWKERYLPRVYLEHVLGGTDKAGFGFRMSPLTYTKTRKEHEKFMKDLVSGRIDDPAFLSSRYVSMAGSDMAIKSYLDYIASDPGNNKWVLPGQIMTFKKMKGTADYFKELAREIDFRAGFLEKKDPAKAKQMEALSSEMKEEAETVDSRLRGVDTSKYTKVPDSPRFGAMRGLYVMRDIWTDINGLGIAGNPAWGGLLKWSGRAQKVFKYTKVPMNIPTQIRNIISNTILMNVSGTNFLKIPGVVSQAVYDVSHNGKYMQLARKYGLESTTFASEELVRIDRELATVKARDNSFDGMWARLSVFFDKYLDVGGRAYQKSEVLFKVAKMIDLMENHGKGEAEAAKLANEALLDYSNVSQGIRMLRTMPLGSPFITFNVKAAAQMVRNIKQHPLATAKYAAIPYLFAEMFLSQNDDLDDEDWDALMEFLPDYMETSFSTMVFPTKNEQGKWEAIDISFFLPWGAHLNLARDVYKQEWGNAVSGTGMFAGPWEIPKAIQLNEDPFTKQPIWNEFDPARQRYEDILGYLASYMIPPMLMPRNRAGDIITGGGPLIKTMMAADFIDGNVGRDGLPRYTMPNALLSWFGVSIQQLGRQDVIKKGYYKQKDLDNINKRFLRMINEPAYAGNSAEAIEKRKELREQYREHWLKKYKESMEWAEHLKSLEKLFSEDKKT